MSSRVAGMAVIHLAYSRVAGIHWYSSRVAGMATGIIREERVSFS